MSKRSDKRQARTEAKLRYGTTQDELTGILKDLKTDYRSGVKQARVGAKMVSQGAARALPALNAIYDKALTGTEPTQSFIQSQLSSLPAGSPFRTAVQVDAAGSISRLAEAKGMSAKELSGRRVDALAGGTREVESLRSQYASDREKTLGQLVSNAKQAGLYASSRYGELRGDAKKLAVTKRGQTLSHKDRVRGQDLSHQDRAASIQAQKERAAAKAKEKNKPKLANPNQQGAMQDNIGAARDAANKLKSLGLSRSKARAIFADPQAAKEFGVKIPKELERSVGLDLAFDGHISRKNVSELRKRGFRVKKFGLPFNDPKNPTIKPKPKTLSVGTGVTGKGNIL
jgi:hypothetical protein